MSQKYAGVPYLKDIIARRSSGKFNPIETFAQNAETIAETMYFLKKIDDGTERGATIGFKVRAPKTKAAIELFARDPKAYFSTCANENDPKEARKESCVIGYGSPANTHYQKSITEIQGQLTITADSIVKSDYMNNALTIAIERGHASEVIKAWVSNGVDINNTTNGHTPLGWAVIRGNFDALHTLLQMNPDVNLT